MNILPWIAQTYTFNIACIKPLKIGPFCSFSGRCCHRDRRRLQVVGLSRALGWRLVQHTRTRLESERLAQVQRVIGKIGKMLQLAQRESIRTLPR